MPFTRRCNFRKCTQNGYVLVSLYLYSQVVAHVPHVVQLTDRPPELPRMEERGLSEKTATTLTSQFTVAVVPIHFQIHAHSSTRFFVPPPAELWVSSPIFLLRLPSPCLRHQLVEPRALLLQPSSSHRLPPPCAMHRHVEPTALLSHPGSSHRLPPPCALHRLVEP